MSGRSRPAQLRRINTKEEVICLSVNSMSHFLHPCKTLACVPLSAIRFVMKL